MIKDFTKQKTVFDTDKFEIGKAYAVYMKDDRDLIHHDMILKRKNDNMLYFAYYGTGDNMYEERISIDKYLDGEYEIYELEKVIPANNKSVNEMVIDQIMCKNTQEMADKMNEEFRE
jgi:hypothetical protein